MRRSWRSKLEFARSVDMEGGAGPKISGTGRTKYTDEKGRQFDKATTIGAARVIVEKAKTILSGTGMFQELNHYQPTDANLQLRGAPALIVDYSQGDRRRVVAPDLRGFLRDGLTVWIEVKDKPQRIKYPDTGADNFQFIGYWAVNTCMGQPVLMMFTDPPLAEM